MKAQFTLGGLLVFIIGASAILVVSLYHRTERAQADGINFTTFNLTLSDEIRIDTIQIGPGQTITFEPGATIKSRLVISAPAR